MSVSSEQPHLTPKFYSNDEFGNYDEFDEAKEIVVEEESEPEEKTTNWGSLTIAFIILLLVGIQYSVYMSSMWPYLQQIDKSADNTFFGWIIAAYSIGQLVSSPIFGIWSNKYKTTRPPVMVGIVINVAANLLYCFVEAFDSNRKWILLIARFITGFGAGIASVLRAYVAEASAAKDRMKAMAIATALMSIGYVLGPAVQAIFATLGYPFYTSGKFHFDQYTAPGWFVILCGLLMLIFMVFFFKTDYVGVYNAGKNFNQYKVLPKFDKFAAGICIWCWFAMLFGFVIGEAVGSPFTMAMFDWTADEAVLNNGIVYAVSGVISFFVYIAFAFVKERANQRICIISGLILLFFFFVTSFPFGDNYGKLNWQIVEIEPGRNISNTTSLPMITNATIAFEATGCDDQYEWCRWTPKIHLGQYLGAYVFSSIGYPMANVMISTTFSFVLGPRRQGTMQGLFIMAGSAARAVGPIFVNYLFKYFGPRVAWGVSAAVVGLTAILVMITYKWLVPLDTDPKSTFRYKRGKVTPM